MKILVSGSRNFTNKAFMKIAILALGNVDCIVQGEARGADRCAKEIARELGIECRSYPAQWKKYGRSAGPLRNQEMLDKEHPDLVVAFPLPGSIGTWDMVERCEEANIKVKIIEEEE